MLSPRDRRAVTAGLLTVGCLVASSRGIPAIIAWRTSSQAASEAVIAGAARAEVVVREGGVLRDSLIARRVRLSVLDTALLQSASPSSAAAELAQIVSDAVETSDAQLGTIQLQADSAPAGPLIHARVQASITGSLAAIARFLVALESGAAMLSVRDLSVARQDAGASQSNDQPLHVDVVVEGIARNPRFTPGVGKP